MNEVDKGREKGERGRNQRESIGQKREKKRKGTEQGEQEV